MNKYLLFYIISVAAAYFSCKWAEKKAGKEKMEQSFYPYNPEAIYMLASFIPVVNLFVVIAFISDLLRWIKKIF